MTATLQRRLGAMEKRMGVDRGLFADFTDLDLLGALQWLGELLAADGDAGAAAMLAAHDAEEGKLRSFHECPDVARVCAPDLEPDVRWPYLRARARYYEPSHSPGLASAASAEDLERKIHDELARMRIAP
jgi:hypothetical protein